MWRKRVLETLSAIECDILLCSLLSTTACRCDVACMCDVDCEGKPVRDTVSIRMWHFVVLFVFHHCVCRCDVACVCDVDCEGEKFIDTVCNGMQHFGFFALCFPSLCVHVPCCTHVWCWMWRKKLLRQSAIECDILLCSLFSITLRACAMLHTCVMSSVKEKSFMTLSAME